MTLRKAATASLFFSLVLFVSAQEGTLSQSSASARLQARVQQAVAGEAKHPAVFVVAAYPVDTTEHSLTAGSGLLMVSVFARKDTESRVKNTILETVRGKVTLPLNRTLRRSLPESPDVSKKLGGSRANYFYILPAFALSGGTVEVQLEEGGSFREPLAPHLFEFVTEPPSKENGAFLKGLQLVAAREFPDYPFNPRVRVSQGVLQGNLVKRVLPMYPAEAREQRVSGGVALKVLIGTDGKVQILSADGPYLLVGPAVDAVKRWVYKPYLLNGSPVEVETQIVVTFSH